MSSAGVEYYHILKGTWYKVTFKLGPVEGLKLTVVSNLIYGVSQHNLVYN